MQLSAAAKASAGYETVVLYQEALREGMLGASAKLMHDRETAGSVDGSAAKTRTEYKDPNLLWKQKLEC